MILVAVVAFLAGALVAISLIALTLAALVIGGGKLLLRWAVGVPITWRPRMFSSIKLWAFAGVLALLCVAATSFYANGHKAGLASERKRMDPWAETICQAAGKPFVETDPKGKALKRGKWGRECLKAVQALASFKAQAETKSAEVVTAHVRTQEKKTGADRVTARRDTERTRKAKQKMEAVDAAVPDTNRVDGSWFDTLNVLGGLPDPEAAAGPDGAGPAPEGDPAG